MAYLHVNGAVSSAAVARDLGGAGTIAVKSGTGPRFGEPTPERPLLIQTGPATAAPDEWRASGHFLCTGRDGDELAVTPLVDADVPVGHLVVGGDPAEKWQAVDGRLDDLQEQAAGLQEQIDDIPGGSGTVTSVGLSMPAGFAVSAPITTSGTLAVTTDLSGLIKAGGGAFSAAVAGTDYVSPSALSSYVTTTSLATTLGGYATTSALAAKADDSAVVHLTGAESVTGRKTLTCPIARGDGTNPAFVVQDSGGSAACAADAAGNFFALTLPFALARLVDLQVGATTPAWRVRYPGTILDAVVSAEVNGASGGGSIQLIRDRSGTLTTLCTATIPANSTAAVTVSSGSFAAVDLAAGDKLYWSASAAGVGLQSIACPVHYKGRHA